MNVVIVVMVTVVFRLESTSMKKLSGFGAFRFSEFRIRDCVPVLPYLTIGNSEFTPHCVCGLCMTW
jgi:hypothetical protein